MWPCKDIDVSWMDVLFALRVCVKRDLTPISDAGFRSASNRSLFCISVRAAFDLYLRSRRWRRGDECIFVGLNVPDMFRIAESYGLRVIGCDIDPITTRLDISQLRASINENSRFIVVPHLFGHRLDLSPVIELAKSLKLDVVEDCAQAFAGSDWSGSEGATLSLFSFGPMKTATALQGAVAIVRDSSLRETMACEQQSYPVQPTWRYAARVVRFAMMTSATQRFVYGLFVRLLRSLGIDHETVIHATTKSATGASFERSLHTQPCTALKQVIRRRVVGSETYFQSRIAKGLILYDAIGESVPLVLRDQQPNVFWMVPILAEAPETLKDLLRDEGFDAMSGRLTTVREHSVDGAKALECAVMLPFSRRMSDFELRRLAFVVTNCTSCLLQLDF